jgi:hypothetical protein
LVGVPTLSVQKIQNYVSIKLLKPSLRLPRRSLKYEFMEISPPLADSFEKTENMSCFPLVGVPPPTNSDYQLYTKAQYYLNAALGVAVEILCPFLWEKIETENPLKRPEHLCIYMLLVEWLTKVMMRYVFNTVCCCFKSLLLHRVFGC